MNMHALNNEGTEGNTMMTRMVEIVDNNGKPHTVNAVSGDMFKHIQAEHLFNEAKSKKLPLCKGCEVFDANRICADESFTKKDGFTKETRDSEILEEAIKRCVVDDAEGILITSNIGKKRSIARKSAIEFGWVVGYPENTKTESYFHAKYVPEGRGKGSGAGENLGQNIFHRPASSGQYAVVVNVDCYKIGRNDITLEYVESVDRQARIKTLLISLLNTFVKPTGAHRNTQHPHILDFSGVVATSSSTLPAPVISALNPAYKEEVARIAANLNKLEENNPVDVKEFNGLASFSEVMADIITAIQPYEA